MSKLTHIPASTATDELVQRPSWLPDGCPDWCEYSDIHGEGDQHEDRAHYSFAKHVEASTEPSEMGTPATMQAHMSQHYREVEPRIWVGRGESNQGHYLTVDEAREYALQILELTKIADGI